MQLENEVFRAPCIEAKFGEIPAFTFSMTVQQLVYIYYVAVRGRDQEDGAVQRPLNSSRIDSIKNYVLDGNTFFNSFIANWTSDSNLVDVRDGVITFPLLPKSAQAIDGQHRLAGLEKAIETDPSVEQRSVIVTLCVGLNTQSAAKIFLNINTEQRPVPRSLIFDLFGLTEDDPKHSINRAADIARQLNEDINSPLHNLLKFPGTQRGVGKIELSTFVTALKKHLEKDGIFAKAHLNSFENQVNVISNYFSAIKSPYVKASIWSSTSKNPFLRAAGFNGAIDFLADRLINECAVKADFSVQAISDILKLEDTGLLKWDDMKGQDGKTAKKNVVTFLEKGLMQKIAGHGSYKF